MVSIRNLSHKAQHSKPWFYFDAEFYVSHCIEVGISPPLGSSDILLQHYIDRGGKLGLSPNPLFDEDFYRRKYPSVARELHLGVRASAFEHYLDVGAAADFSPNWLFDGNFYRSQNRDLTDENIRAGRFSDRYAHYLTVGIGEMRSAHWICDFLNKVTGETRIPSNISQLCAFLFDETQVPELFKPIFNYNWMKERYEWGRTVRPNGFIRHYLLNVKAKKLSPSPYFDEAYYLASDLEVQASVEEEKFSSGYEHFSRIGMTEWRRPFAGFDPYYYFEANMLTPQGAARPPSPALPFMHFLRNRSTMRLAISKPLAAKDIAEDTAKGLYERRCALNAARLGELRFTPEGSTPDVSILIVARDNFEQTANCILSAVFTTSAKIEVILFDNGSTDDIRNVPFINARIKYIRSEENLGFTIAVNRAAQSASGRMILLLNNDAELAPAAVDFALETLEADGGIGAVGAKVVRMHGRLQEGGSLVWRDGSCLGYGRDKDPLDGQVSFVRDVDFCSGCFLAVMKVDWEDLGGFDEAYAPAYYEETDFCIRLWERGKRVVYDPRIMVWHYEFGSSSIREEPLALMRRNQRYFASKHRAFLAESLPPSLANVERARLRHVTGLRTLFVEDMLPDPMRGMGFTRSAAVAQCLAQASGLTSILGLHNKRWSSSLSEDAGGRRVEILTNTNTETINDFFRDRVGVYNLLWISRTHNLARLKEWRGANPDFFAKVRIVLDTEAIAATRRFGYMQQADRVADLEELVREELEHLDAIDHICVVNELDRALLQALLTDRGLNIPVSILGHSLRATSKPPIFSETTDIVLAGSYSTPDGPNADGLLWFDRAIRPLMPDLPGLRFVIAGSEAASFVGSARLVHNYQIIDNPRHMADVYRHARLMIAPTRFAAGLPMKVHEAASHGVPVVMTDLLAAQLGWLRDGIAAVPIIPEAMAAAIVTLALDSEAWQRTQALQLELVARDCDPAAFDATIRHIVGSGERPSGAKTKSGAIKR